MEFGRRLLATLGIGGAKVYSEPVGPVRPGEVLRGSVLIAGGDAAQRIDDLTVGLQARAMMDKGETEWDVILEFARAHVETGIDIASGERKKLDFELAVPYEAPLTRLDGTPISGMGVGLDTRLHLHGAVDAADLDPVDVEPLPAQLAVVEALRERGAELERAVLHRGPGPLGAPEDFFHQSLEYGIADRHLSLVMRADAEGCEVAVVVAGRRGPARQVRVEGADPEPGLRELLAPPVVLEGA
ncbi:sporulation protein [Nocardiopsis sp. CNT-189]|uniref:sporulation protein n=1 Tax=Nocardiopsis oceanisediminis TaxID=2816862 RepID=UPI003B29B9A3